MFSNIQLSKRNKLLLIIAAILWAIIIIRLIYLQVFSHEKYKTEVAENIQREVSLEARRGVIYDANMNQLATNKTVYRVFVAPKTLSELIDDGKLKNSIKSEIADKFAEVLGTDTKEVLEILEKDYRLDETIKREVEEEELAEINAFAEEKGLTTVIYSEEESKRYYPYGDLGAQVIGLEGTDGGLFGLELQYNDTLSGTPGNSITAKNGSGYAMPFKYNSYSEATDGYNVVSTINIEVQKILQDQCKETYEENMPGDRVTGIIQNVKTGEIVACATYPSFDLNDPFVLDEDSQRKLDEEYDKETEEYDKAYWESVNKMWRNKSITETYEPGSTFKIITSAMALDSRAAEFTDTFYCGGYLRFDGYDDMIKCWVYPDAHGTITFSRGLQQSCNVTFMSVAKLIGKERFYKYFNEFGYTEKTGIDLPGEAMSIVSDYANFNDVELAVYSFGQTFKVTPIQHITALSTVANGGYLVTPRVVSRITDSAGNTIQSFGTDVRRQVISTETCKLVAKSLAEGVATDGGAKNAYVEGYSVAAKTGTSQKRENLNSDGSSNQIVASCIAYAPSYDPQYAVLLLVDEPLDSEWGSLAAAPYVADIISQSFPVLGVYKSGDESNVAALVAVPDYVGQNTETAMSKLENKGLNAIVLGDGETVNEQVPSPGTTLEEGNGIVYLYTGYMTSENSLIEVPNLVGLSSEVARQTLNAYGFNCNAEGRVDTAVAGAVVTNQSINPGELAAPGTIITVKVRFTDGGDG